MSLRKVIYFMVRKSYTETFYWAGPRIRNRLSVITEVTILSKVHNLSQHIYLYIFSAKQAQLYCTDLCNRDGQVSLSASVITLHYSSVFRQKKTVGSIIFCDYAIHAWKCFLHYSSVFRQKKHLAVLFFVITRFMHGSVFVIDFWGW